MFLYISINLLIVFGGLIFETFVENKKTVNLMLNEKTNSNLFFVPTFSLLFFISAFRGDFTSDYKNYSVLFKFYNQFSFMDIIRIDLYQEKGFILLNKLIGLFTDNQLFVFIIVTLIILFNFFHEIKKNSKYIWLSVLMFVTIGSFYTSFNIMRHILAVSIVFSGSKYLYNRNFLKYGLIVLIAASFHKTALIMLVFYFILNYNFSVKKFVLIFLGSLITLLYLENILSFAQRFFYSIYTANSYGMSGLRFTNVILPIFILIFVLLHYKNIPLKDKKNNIWVNSAVFYVFFSILGLKVQLIQRFAEFFSPYMLLLIPLLISKIEGKRLRVIYIFVSIIFFISYNFFTLSGTGYDPYYFIWD